MHLQINIKHKTNVEAENEVETIIKKVQLNDKLREKHSKNFMM